MNALDELVTRVAALEQTAGAHEARLNVHDSIIAKWVASILHKWEVPPVPKPKK